MDENAQIPDQLAKLNLMRTTILVENLVRNLILIGRDSLEKAIKDTPEKAKNEEFYSILVHTLSYYDTVNPPNEK